MNKGVNQHGAILVVVMTITTVLSLLVLKMIMHTDALARIATYRYRAEKKDLYVRTIMHHAIVWATEHYQQVLSMHTASPMALEYGPLQDPDLCGLYWVSMQSKKECIVCTMRHLSKQEEHEIMSWNLFIQDNSVRVEGLKIPKIQHS